MVRAVIQRDNDHTARAFHDARRIAAARIAQIIHLAAMFKRQPFRQALQFRESFSTGNAAKIEAKISGLRHNPARSFRRVHHNIMHDRS